MRPLIVIVAAVALVIATGAGAREVSSVRQRDGAALAAEAGRVRLERELAGWNGGASIATREARGECERTLSLLRDVYAQERRLWAYYDAGARSAWTRAKLAAERAELERAAARHAAELERVEREAALLRPDERSAPIEFTPGAAAPHQDAEAPAPRKEK